MKQRTSKVLMGDFETTVFEGQTFTEVWASALVEMYTEDVHVLSSLDDTYAYLLSLDSNITLYYHNLKFDGSFWLSYLMFTLQFKQAYEVNDSGTIIGMKKAKDLKNGEYTYCISDMGQWYSLTFKACGHVIEIRDSLKLLPFSVKEIGDSFKTKHRKLDMEYKGFRYAGCTITDQEREYIANDVLVVKEALEIMFNEGHKKMTIGSCCLAEFRSYFSEVDYNTYFPDLYDIPVSAKLFPEFEGMNSDDYIRKSYHGGWCYVVKGKENKLAFNGTTADVNSLYPSMMSSESGNRYPIGKPHYWKGNMPEVAKEADKYYFVRIRTRFHIKPNMLPTIQIKGNKLYKPTEWLETSDIYNPRDGQYYDHYYDVNGERKEALVTLTLTMTDYQLLQDHYTLTDFEMLDGCWFFSEIGIFDDYINKYRKIKMESKGALRQLAKLFLNNLYGKFASSRDSSFKVACEGDEGEVQFTDVQQFDKQAGYIAIGSAITSYSRNFTIRSAQMNYYGVNARGFIYADTDSIHCDLTEHEIRGIRVDPVNFCCWKLEGSWDKALFVRQKTYIEHIVRENLEPVEPYYSVRCAGMNDACKELFVASMEHKTEDEWKMHEDVKVREWWDKLPKYQQEFVLVNRDMTDFKLGLKIPAKLMPKRIRGGILLCDTTYEMR